MILFALILLVRRSPVAKLDAATTRTLAALLVISMTALGQSNVHCFAQNYGGLRDNRQANSGDDNPVGVAPGEPIDQMVAGNSAKDVRLLREGTLIPPTVGQIVPIGRRWGFAPANPDMISMRQLASTRDDFRALASGMHNKPRPTRLGGATVVVTGADIPRATAQRYGESPREETQTVDRDGSVKHLVLAENLMLQRIVEAIVNDPSDNKWTVSGEITEFRNENRLIIRTAQRANTN